MEELKLNFIDMDFWGRPVYKDQHGILWKDLNLGDSETPSLYSATENSFDGEPLSPIDLDCIVIEQYKRNEKEFQYMMLSRLKSDCTTHLSDGCHPSCRIQEENIDGVIKEMKDLWNQFTETEKPEWLTWEQILGFEKQLKDGSTKPCKTART